MSSTPGRSFPFFLLLAAVVAVGTWAAVLCGEIFGEHDSGKIVIDEVAGMLVTLYSFPADPVWLAAAFFTFRFYDIFKPFPIRRIDREWKSAGGVMTATAFGHGCVCHYPMFSSLALFHMPGSEAMRPQAVRDSWEAK